MISKVADVMASLQKAVARAGRPDAVILRINARWISDGIAGYRGEDVVVGWWGESGLTINIGGKLFRVPSRIGKAEVADPVSMEMRFWGLSKLGPGTWDIDPSINQVGSLHAYFVLCEVPEPAPFELVAL